MTCRQRALAANGWVPVGKAELTIAEATAMFLHVAQGMQDSQDLLTQADKAIGDGDHGIGMSRGFAAVQAKLSASPPTTVADLLKTTGMALLTSIGGASGVIFGTLFRGGARNLTGATIFNAETLSLMLADGLAAVQERGKANPGDKTMVDALTPAAAKAAEMAGASLGEALQAAPRLPGSAWRRRRAWSPRPARRGLWDRVRLALPTLGRSRCI